MTAAEADTGFEDHARRIAPRGSGLYYALRFAVPWQRQGLLAVHAYADEVLRIPSTVSDPGVATVKLDWWRHELERATDGDGRHPVARALAEAIREHHLPVSPLRDLLDGVAMDLEYGSYPDFGDLSVYLHRTSGALAGLTVRICDPDTGGNETFAHDLGMGLGLFTLLRDLRPLADRGHCYIPEAELRAAGLGPGDLRGPATPAALRPVLATQAERADQFLRQAEQALPRERRRAQRFALIRCAQARALLREMAAEDYPLLDRGFRLTPLRKLWLAWRTVRRNR